MATVSRNKWVSAWSALSHLSPVAMVGVQTCINQNTYHRLKLSPWTSHFLLSLDPLALHSCSRQNSVFPPPQYYELMFSKSRHNIPVGQAKGQPEETGLALHPIQRYHGLNTCSLSEEVQMELNLSEGLKEPRAGAGEGGRNTYTSPKSALRPLLI